MFIQSFPLPLCCARKILNLRRVFVRGWKRLGCFRGATCRSGSAHLLVLRLPSLTLRLDSAAQLLLEVPPELFGLRPQPGGHSPAGTGHLINRTLFFLLFFFFSPCEKIR